MFQTCAAFPALSHLFPKAFSKVSLNLKGINDSHFNIKTEHQETVSCPRPWWASGTGKEGTKSEETGMCVDGAEGRSASEILR